MQNRLPGRIRIMSAPSVVSTLDWRNRCCSAAAMSFTNSALPALSGTCACYPLMLLCYPTGSRCIGGAAIPLSAAHDMLTTCCSECCQHADLQNPDAVPCAAQRHTKNDKFMMGKKLTGTDVQLRFKQLCEVSWPENGIGSCGGICLHRIHALPVSGLWSSCRYAWYL